MTEFHLNEQQQTIAMAALAAALRESIIVLSESGASLEVAKRRLTNTVKNMPSDYLPMENEIAGIGAALALIEFIFRTVGEK